jgi:hypothetical protein
MLGDSINSIFEKCSTKTCAGCLLKKANVRGSNRAI